METAIPTLIDLIIRAEALRLAGATHRGVGQTSQSEQHGASSGVTMMTTTVLTAFPTSHLVLRPPRQQPFRLWHKSSLCRNNFGTKHVGSTTVTLVHQSFFNCEM
jgi:hypothetical protein